MESKLYTPTRYGIAYFTSLHLHYPWGGSHQLAEMQTSSIAQPLRQLRHQSPPSSHYHREPAIPYEIYYAKPDNVKLLHKNNTQRFTYLAAPAMADNMHGAHTINCLHCMVCTVYNPVAHLLYGLRNILQANDKRSTSRLEGQFTASNRGRQLAT